MNNFIKTLTFEHDLEHDFIISINEVHRRLNLKKQHILFIFHRNHLN